MVPVKQDDLIESVRAALQYISFYHPVDYIENLARAYDLEQTSIYRFYADACGVTIRSGHRTLEAVGAPRRIARLLETKPGAPMLYVRSVGREASGEPVEFFEAWHRGDRTQFEIDVGGPTRSAGIIAGADGAEAR